MDTKPAESPYEFFPSLKRRDGYSVKSEGEYYAYRYYREHFQHEIAEDCLCRCVYCDAHEDEVGGRAQMQIDHFRPYTRAGFEHLENVPENFHHACVRCNSLKSDKWPSKHPSEPHDDIAGFVDPFKDDRRLYFRVADDGGLVALRPPAEYLIRVLALNRKHMKLIRLHRIYIGLLNKYEDENRARWEAACRDEGVTHEELVKVATEFAEYRRLHGLSVSCFKK